jgi:two-component system sensor histidine kinase/response regulator
MDIRMPVMDGVEATQRIRSAEGASEDFELAPCKIVALTASAFEHDRETILGIGCDDFVTKPFRDSTLFAKIEEHLGARFVYETGSVEDGQPGASAVLSPSRFSVLPGGLVAELGEVAVLGDMAAAHDVIDRIQPYDGALAAELRRLVRGYRFEEIQALVAE